MYIYFQQYPFQLSENVSVVFGICYNLAMPKSGAESWLLRSSPSLRHTHAHASGRLQLRKLLHHCCTSWDRLRMIRLEAEQSYECFIPRVLQRAIEVQHLETLLQ